MKIKQTQKGALHPRNRHQGRYDFKQLEQFCPELADYVISNPAGDRSIDFANPEAVKLLNRALLKQNYALEYWDIPSQYLCPPIPGRADYIHYLADLIAQKKGAKVLDIGVGANCIYPVIGHHEYGWSFVGSDIDQGALSSAQKIIDLNSNLNSAIELRLQKNSKKIFEGVVLEGDYFDLTMCNPPFHSSAEEVLQINQRKWRNLGKAAVANFGGQSNELWCEGGEVAFILKMIEESKSFSNKVNWFTALVSKSESLSPLYDALRKLKVKDWKTIEMAQGQKKSRFIAWTF